MFSQFSHVFFLVFASSNPCLVLVLSHHGDGRCSLLPREHSDFPVIFIFANQTDNFVVACLDASIAECSEFGSTFTHSFPAFLCLSFKHNHIAEIVIIIVPTKDHDLCVIERGNGGLVTWTENSGACLKEFPSISSI